MKTEHIFDLLYAGYGINIKELNIKELRDYYIISMCRYAQFYAFISVIELPRIPAYRPKIHSLTPSRKVITFYKLLFAIFSRFSLLS